MLHVCATCAPAKGTCDAGQRDRGGPSPPCTTTASTANPCTATPSTQPAHLLHRHDAPQLDLALLQGGGGAHEGLVLGLQGNEGQHGSLASHTLALALAESASLPFDQSVEHNTVSRTLPHPTHHPPIPLKQTPHYHATHTHTGRSLPRPPPLLPEGRSSKGTQTGKTSLRGRRAGARGKQGKAEKGVCQVSVGAAGAVGHGSAAECWQRRQRQRRPGERRRAVPPASCGPCSLKCSTVCCFMPSTLPVSSRTT